MLRPIANALLATCWSVLAAQEPLPDHVFDLNPATLRSGERLQLPEVEMAPWTTARFLVVDAVYGGVHSGLLRVEFRDDPRANNPQIHFRVGLLPALPTRVVLPLHHLDGQTFFLARRPRQLKGMVPGRRLDPGDVRRVDVVLQRGSEESATLRIDGIRLTHEPPPPLPAAEPVVDALGQWTAREWPGKAVSEAGMTTGLRTLHRSVTGPDAVAPSGRSRYGGFTARRFEASGWFRMERDDTRWWLVDPDGYAFFSTGIDCVSPSSSGSTTGMEDLFTWLPEPGGAFASAVHERGGRSDVSFVTINLIRAFGDDWRVRWEELAAGLLRRYGFNTIGNWSDRGFATRSGMPWVLPLGGFPSTPEKIYRDFPDVFSPDYAEASQAFARQMVAHRDDRNLIGYFLRNEPSWAFGGNNLAAEMLATAARSATRDALVDWLRKRYRNAEALTAAWGIDVASFDALQKSAWPGIADRSTGARDDLWEFSERMVHTYLRLPSEALREVSPQHLNLGIRYAWISSDLCYIGAAELFDVFSVNVYSERPVAEEFARITERTDLPVLIGEFHHGAVDRGLPSTGLRGVRTQTDRGLAYRAYVEHGASIPSLVGVHYFQWNDQPVLGRFDGENYNIGFVDVCCRPHPEFVELVTTTNRGLFQVLTGARSPTDVRPETIPAICF